MGDHVEDHVVKFAHDLASVAIMVRNGANYPACIKSFISFVMDELNLGKVFDAISTEPITINPVLDAHIAGICEKIAFSKGVPCPFWTQKRERYLDVPVFENGINQLELVGLSSRYFSKRNLFISGDLLSESVSVQDLNDSQAI